MRGILFKILFLLLIKSNANSAIFMVTSDLDMGSGTLRTALTLANSTVGKDTIQFNIGGMGSWSINLLTSLPDITDSLFIDGLSQPFSQYPNNEVQVNGSPISSSVFIVIKPNIQICGLRIVSNPSQYGIYFPNSSTSNLIFSYSLFKNLVLENCYIGIYARGDNYIDFIVDSNIFLNLESGLVVTLRDTSRNFKLMNNSFHGNGSANGLACKIATETNIDTNVTKLLVYNNQVSTFTSGIVFFCQGQIDSVVVENNSFKNMTGGGVTLYNRGSTIINSIKIVENYFDSTNTGQGIGLGQEGTGNTIAKYKSVIINRNIIFSSNSNGIRIVQSGTGDLRCRISELQIRQNEIYCINGIQLSLGGTGNVNGRVSNLEIDSNIIMGANQHTGIEIRISGTGYTIYRIFDFIIRRNVISNYWNGVVIEIQGTGYRRNYIYNYSIEENIIQNCTFSGIKKSVGGPNAIESYIFNGKIFRNIISNCGLDGINISARSGSLQPLIFQIVNQSIKENIIRDNGRHGVYVSNDGKVVTGINIRRNSIYNNDSLGIKTFDYQNAYGNPVIPAPVLDSVVFSGAQALLYGHLNTKPNSGYAIEVFSSTTPDPSGFGEGENYLRMSSHLTDTAGYAAFVIPLNGVSSFDYFSVTATDTLINTTSPFSNAISSFTTALNEVSKQELLIYPNPTTNLVFVSIPPSSKIYQIELMNLTGQVISRFDVKDGESVLNFSTLNYPNGCYFLKAFGETSLLSKLIIQHD